MSGYEALEDLFFIFSLLLRKNKRLFLDTVFFFSVIFMYFFCFLISMGYYFLPGKNATIKIGG